MSTATIAVDNVRPLAAIKADAANFLANKPESVFADIKGAIAWLPRKARAAAMRAAQFLHVPQFAQFVRTNFARFIGLVGKGAFITEVLTSHWGQASIRKGIKWGAALVTFATKWSWKIITSPLRLFAPTQSLLLKFEAGVAKANAKLTPDSGETFGALQVGRDVAGYYVSADRTHMKLARTTAFAVMSVRITRRFVPVGWMRFAMYVLDGLIIANNLNDVLANTWIGRRLTAAQVQLEADVVRQGETVVAEATTMTREAASESAEKLRAEAALLETEGKKAAEALRADMVTEAAQQAEELRAEATAMEQTAERLAAAETATAATEAAQESSTVLTVVEDRPKPGPSVPPMGGRAPSNGPVQQSHSNKGGSGKGKPRPPQQH